MNRRSFLGSICGFLGVTILLGEATPPLEEARILARIKRLEELKLEIIARNPQLLCILPYQAK